MKNQARCDNLCWACEDLLLLDYIKCVKYMYRLGLSYQFVLEGLTTWNNMHLYHEL